MQQGLFQSIYISGGLRIDYNNIYGTEFIPHAGLSYVLNNATTFKGAVSKGYRCPTITETYVFMPNKNLKPENIYNYEVSVSKSILGKRFSTELTGFIID